MGKFASMSHLADKSASCSRLMNESLASAKCSSFIYKRVCCLKSYATKWKWSTAVHYSSVSTQAKRFYLHLWWSNTELFPSEIHRTYDNDTAKMLLNGNICKCKYISYFPKHSSYEATSSIWLRTLRLLCISVENWITKLWTVLNIVILLTKCWNAIFAEWISKLFTDEILINKQ